MTEEKNVRFYYLESAIPFLNFLLDQKVTKSQGCTG
jgi:hypothetical protein